MKSQIQDTQEPQEPVDPYYRHIAEGILDAFSSKSKYISFDLDNGPICYSDVFEFDSTLYGIRSLEGLNRLARYLKIFDRANDIPKQIRKLVVKKIRDNQKAYEERKNTKG